MTNEHEFLDLSRNQLRKVMANLTEGVILLDSDASIVWANQAALDMHACTYINELGETADTYIQQFGLEVAQFDSDGNMIGALNETVPVVSVNHPIVGLLQGNEFDTQVLLLSNPNKPKAVKSTLEFRGLCIRNSKGKIATLVLFVIDITETIYIDDMFEQFFASKPAPAVILRLDDSRYIRINQSFCAMTGFERDEVLHRPLHEIDVLQRAQHYDQVVQALAQHQAIPPQTSVVRTRNGENKEVVMAGQPIVLEGRPCMLLTFIDLDAHKRAEHSLRQSEDRFAKAFNLAPVAMLICQLNNQQQVIEVNSAFMEAVDRSKDKIIGLPVSQSGVQLPKKVWHTVIQRLKRKGTVRNQEVQLCVPNGAAVDGLLSAEWVLIHDEACGLFVIQDITERKHTEKELIRAIEAVMKDASWFSRTVMEKLAQVRNPQVNTMGFDILSRREQEILELLCAGYGNGEVADILNLSPNTIRNHVAAIYNKIGVNRRSAAIVWGRERGFGS